MKKRELLAYANRLEKLIMSISIDHEDGCECKACVWTSRWPLVRSQWRKMAKQDDAMGKRYGVQP